jgi:hypothetical protein
MTSVAPWISVEPSSIPAAILGPLPIEPGSAACELPTSVVPASATGILVFAWYAVLGRINEPGWWHFGVNLEGGAQNWFSLMIAGATPSHEVSACNSQTFWLPMPVDGKLQVTFFNGQISPASAFEGGVEIHGYSLG